MNASHSAPRFPLGKVISTRGASAAHAPEHIEACLDRHARGDWGDLSTADLDANDAALASDERILSAYRSAGRATLWIITEADRTVTTVLLPDEY